MTTKTILTVACALCTLGIGAHGRAQGTIDPASVNTRQVLQFNLANPSGQSASLLAVDASVNYYCRENTSMFVDGLVKYDATGQTVWERQRTIRAGTTPDGANAYFESWYPNGPETQVPADQGMELLDIQKTVVDAAGNVTLACQVYVPGSAIPGQNVVLSTRTAYVRFDAAGNLVWETYAMPQPDSSQGFGSWHVIQDFQLGPNGSVYALTELLTSDTSFYTNSGVVCVSGGGSVVYTSDFGYSTGDGYNFSNPLAMAVDAAGEAYLVSSDGRQANQGTDPAFPVGWAIRRLNTAGKVMNAASVPPIDPVDDQLSETWFAAGLDESGNLYIGATYFRSVDSFDQPQTGHQGQLLRKFDPSVNPLYAIKEDDAPFTGEQPSHYVYSLLVGANDITLVGTIFLSSGPQGSDSWELARYAQNDGHRIWQQVYQAPSTPVTPGGGYYGNETTAYYGILDVDDNLYIQALIPSPTTGGSLDEVIAKYSAKGDLQFIKPLDSTVYGEIGHGSLTLPTDNRITFFTELSDASANYPFAIFDTDNPAVVPAVSHAPFFTGEVPLSGGVYYLAFPSGNYFGYYSYLTDPAYIYHFDLGYEYVFDAADNKSGVYLYDFASNDFFYTSPGFPFPYLYDFSLNSVLYYYPDPNNAGHYNTNSIRYFYDFNTGAIISK